MARRLSAACWRHWQAARLGLERLSIVDSQASLASVPPCVNVEVTAPTVASMPMQHCFSTLSTTTLHSRFIFTSPRRSAELESSSTSSKPYVPASIAATSSSILSTSAVEGALPSNRVARAVLAKIKQSPKKVNLVAKLVRGMTAEDALLQMAVSKKRAAVTIARAITAARANAAKNHGLPFDDLVIAEAFVGKGRYLKRTNPHGRGRAGIKHRARCRVTVVVRAMNEEEKQRRQERVEEMQRKRFLRKKILKLAPHRLVTVGKKEDTDAEPQSV